MKKYVVERNQNLYDIAILLYGTIEGIFDLMFSNEWLNMDVELSQGDEIYYHENLALNENVIKGLSGNEVIPANNIDFHYYAPMMSEDAKILFLPLNKGDEINLAVKGRGKMKFNWGDGDTDEYSLSPNQKVNISHVYDEWEQTKCVVAGDFEINEIDLTNTSAQMYLLQTAIIRKFTNHTCPIQAKTLPLSDRRYSINIDLSNAVLFDIRNLGMMDNIEELNLKGCKLKNEDVFYEYIKTASKLGACKTKVMMSFVPNQQSRDIMQRMIEDVPMGQQVGWQFIINGKEYSNNGENFK